MNLPNNDVDPDGLLEYSVVFTDRSLNHMSQRFVGVVQETLDTLCATYGAHSAAIVPGGGTFAMESVARQLATGRRALVVRNGLFSYRWSQILEVGAITDDVTVCQARPTTNDPQATWEPAPVDEVVETIRQQRPHVVFAPHVETAAGMVLPDSYLKAVSAAVHEVGGLFVLDCVASGALWVDMADIGVDVLVTAPQKGWSGSPGAGYVLLGDDGREAVLSTTTTSFAADLKKWLSIADEYREGRAPYHATMPTDTLTHNLELMRETVGHGLETLRSAQVELGARVRELLASHGLAPVAAGEFAAPSVVVVHTDDPGLRTGATFKAAGLQVAAGVPLQCGEGEDFSTFRIGLFGLDKLGDVDAAVGRLERALETITAG
ncbi:MAG: aminotransferase class V-fold PLP-dependent enzyme [Actinomycetaceae bacterium]